MAKVKLSKAQQAVMDDAREQIDRARRFERMIDWYMDDDYWRNRGKSAEEVIEYLKSRTFGFEDYNGYDYYEKAWQDRKNGIALTMCNSRTLYKLQEMGLIEIVEDSKGATYGIDKVKVLNY